MTKTATIHAQQKWEYLTVTRRSESGIMEELNNVGQGGWELTSIAHDKDRKGEMVWTAFLKRPFVPGAAPPVEKGKGEDAKGLPEEHRIQPDATSGFDVDGEEFQLKAEEEEEEESKESQEPAEQ